MTFKYNCLKIKLIYIHIDERRSFEVKKYKKSIAKNCLEKCQLVEEPLGFHIYFNIFTRGSILIQT